MHEAYKHLMQQQNPNEDRAAFFEKLDSAPTGKTPIYKKILIAAACLCLLVPPAVLAVENIFDVSIVRIGPRKDLEGNDVIGYNIDFVTTKEIPLEEFSEKWQYIDEDITVQYESWQELQEDMGYDLLENPVLETQYRPYTPLIQYRTDGARATQCSVFYRSFEGQLWSVNTYAGYIKDGRKIILTTETLVEHPNIPQDVKDVFTSVQYLLNDESDLEKYSTEEYTAANGLTATLLTYNLGSSIVSYDAYFRANGVRYNVSMDGCLEDQMPETRDRMIEILEAFTME